MRELEGAREASKHTKGWQIREHTKSQTEIPWPELRYRRGCMKQERAAPWRKTCGVNGKFI